MKLTKNQHHIIKEVPLLFTNTPMHAIQRKDIPKNSKVLILWSARILTDPQL